MGTARAEIVNTARGTSPLHILVVDDEPLVAAAIRMMLDQHDVSVAAGGEAALAELATASFDVVLCDLMMPDVSGIELYDHCREHQPELAERLVFMTGASYRLSDFLSRVTNPRIEKPFDGQTLREMVGAFIR